VNDVPAAITVLLNPAAGGASDGDLSSRLTELFQAAGAPARIVLTGSPADVVEAARSAARSGADAVVAAGGDGTVNRVASALVGLGKTKTALGVLPIGTLNHFAKDLGIPLDLEQAVQIIAAHRVSPVDVGEVNGRIFVNNSSIGVYPDIVVERERLRREGYRKWTALAVATAKILWRYRGLVVRIDADASTARARTPFLFVGNNEYQADGLNLGARARLDGGRLFAYLAPRVHAWDLPRLLASALIGHAKETHELQSFAATELHVKTPGRRRLRVAADGEVMLMTTPLRYVVRPRALGVIAPER
jgi:diacylglycerol kinase family enzyme